MDEMQPPARSPWDRPVDGTPVPPPPSPWAPPIAPTATTPAANAASWTPQPERPHRRRWPIAVACVALVAAGGIGVAAVVGGNDDEPAEQATQQVDLEPVVTTADTQPDTSQAPPADGSFSFDVARQASSASDPVRMKMTTTAMGMETVMEGELDASQRLHMTMSSSGASIEMIMDIDGNAAYFKGAGFGEMVSGDAEWLSMDLESMMAETGQSLDGMRQMMGGIPVADFEEAPEQIGFDEIDGERVMHYRVHVSAEEFQRLIGANPQFVPGGVVADVASEMGDLTYHFFVTQDNRLRRMEFDMDMSGTTAHTVYDMWPLEPGFTVELPDPSTVQSLYDL